MNESLSTEGDTEFSVRAVSGGTTFVPQRHVWVYRLDDGGLLFNIYVLTNAQFSSGSV